MGTLTKEELEKAFDEVHERYIKAFDDIFPTQCALGMGFERMIEAMESCIAEEKDAWEIGYFRLRDEDGNRILY